MEPDEVQREIVIDAPIERVWNLVTTQENFAAWYAAGGAEIDLRPGGSMLMRWDEHGEFLAVVEVVEAPHRFVYRFAREPNQAPRPGNSTRAELVLEAIGSKTRVVVTETGFAELDIDPEERRAYAQTEGQGWTAGLAALRDHAQHGIRR
jgi:uncharacterized protein YndB with AHSA1/START domain